MSIFWTQKSLNNWGNKLQSKERKKEREREKERKREREKERKREREKERRKERKITQESNFAQMFANEQRKFFSVFIISKLNSFRFAYQNIQTILPQLVQKQILLSSYILLLYLHNKSWLGKIRNTLSSGLQYKTHKYLETSEK